MRGRLAGAVLSLLLALPAQAALRFEALAELPEDEQYARLSLMLLIAGGAEPALVEALVRAYGGDAPGTPDPRRLRTPLARIVDEQGMREAAAQMLDFVRAHRDALRARLDLLEEQEPRSVSRLDLATLAEDALVIRQAIADSLESSPLAARPDLPPLLASYREGTLRLRNLLEFEQFSAELDRLTAEAIESTGGRLDAYQRMFDDELGSDTFDRHIDAAEYLYTREFDPRAGDLSERIIENMVLLESQPNR